MSAAELGEAESASAELEFRSSARHMRIRAFKVSAAFILSLISQYKTRSESARARCLITSLIAVWLVLLRTSAVSQPRVWVYLLLLLILFFLGILTFLYTM